jgi:hypothetical protein
MLSESTQYKVDDRMINEYGAVCGMRKVKKPVKVSL